MYRTALILLACLGFSAGPAAAQVVTGTAVAIDGDTLEFTGNRLRLAGIDAPELAQACMRAGEEWTCGKAAADALRTMTEGGPLTCTATGSSSDEGVPYARCRNLAGDVSVAIAGAGLAVALTGDDQTAEAEARARRLSLGLWATEFEQPATWRLAHPDPKPKRAAPARAAPAPRARVYRNEWGCAIKGNWSRRGDMIYHLPGMEHYDQTRAEAFFCTEAEAQSAGYRRSKE